MQAVDQKTRWAVALVHGVGTSDPTEMLADVTRTLSAAKPGLVFDDSTHVQDPGTPVEVYHRSGASDRSMLRVAAAHWGHLSYVEPGVRGTARTIKNLLGGLCDVAIQVTSQPGWRMRVMRTAFRLLFFLLLGPLLALYLIAAVLAMLVWLAPDGMFAKGDLNAAIAIIVVGVGSIVAGLALIARRRRIVQPTQDWRCLWYSLIGVGAATVIGVLAGVKGAVRGLLLAKEYDVSYSAQEGDVACALCEQAQVITSHTMGLYLSANWLVQDQIMRLGLIALGVAILAYVSSVFRGGRGGTGLVLAERRGLRAACVSAALFWITFAFLVEPLDFLTAWAIGRSTGNQGYPVFWYEQALVVWIICALLLVSLVWFWRAQRLNAATARKPTGGESRKPLGEIRPLRLLIAPVVEVWTLGLAAFVVVFALINDYAISNPSQEALDPEFVSFWPIWIGLCLLAIVGLSFSSGIRHGLHIACDVVGHFAMPSSGFPVRTQIGRRFLATIRFLKDAADGEEQELLIVAHSQGTVIVLDQLVAGLWERELRGYFSSVTILTFGSPITHLYQNYFPSQYPPRDGTLSYGVPRTDFRWCNVYRVDDFVGTELAGQGVEEQVAGEMGGHGRYWDRGLFERIGKFLPP